MADGSMKYHPVPVDEALFRQGLSLWASGVAIVTCLEDGQPHGLTISSFTSVSSSPPRILFCLSKQSRSARAFTRADEVAVNILPQGRLEVARDFAGGAAPGERFTPADWNYADGRPPRLLDALVHLRGQVRNRLDARTHDIFIIDVEHAASSPGRPLIYFDRDFQGLAAAPPAVIPVDAAPSH